MMMTISRTWSSEGRWWWSWKWWLQCWLWWQQSKPGFEKCDSDDNMMMMTINRTLSWEAQAVEASFHLLCGPATGKCHRNYAFSWTSLLAAIIFMNMILSGYWAISWLIWRINLRVRLLWMISTSFWSQLLVYIVRFGLCFVRISKPYFQTGAHILCSEKKCWILLCFALYTESMLYLHILWYLSSWKC